MARPDKLGDTFSDGERARLEQLRLGYNTPVQVASEAGLDPNMLGFAQWLVAHNRIGEQLKPGESPKATAADSETPDTLARVSPRPRSQFEMRGLIPPRRDGTR